VNGSNNCTSATIHATNRIDNKKNCAPHFPFFPDQTPYKLVTLQPAINVEDYVQRVFSTQTNAAKHLSFTCSRRIISGYGLTKPEKSFAFANQYWQNSTRTIFLSDCCVHVAQGTTFVVCL
jgi:hypothetical protein